MPITFIGVGTAGIANGTAPVPIFPVEPLLINDLLVAAFYSREAVDGTVGISSPGWTQIYNGRGAGGLLALFHHFYQGPGDLVPVFTVGGHVAGTSGDTAFAQIAAFRGVDFEGTVSVIGTVLNGASAVNIGAVPGITLPGGALCLVVGGKRDDFTSVAPLSGDGLTWNELGEPKSTLGADAGMVWDYTINSTSNPIVVTNKTFTVTGGVAATSRGIMIALKGIPTAVLEANVGGVLVQFGTDLIAAMDWARTAAGLAGVSATVTDLSTGKIVWKVGL